MLLYMNGTTVSPDFLHNGLLGEGKNITYFERCISSDLFVTAPGSPYRPAHKLPPIDWSNNNEWGTRPSNFFDEPYRYYDRIRRQWIVETT